MQYRYFKKKKRNIVRDGLSSQEHKKNSISLLFLWNNCIVVWRWGSMMIWPNNAKEKNDQTKLTGRKWKLEEMQSMSDRIIWYRSKASFGISKHFFVSESFNYCCHTIDWNSFFFKLILSKTEINGGCKDKLNIELKIFLPLTSIF